MRVQENPQYRAMRNDGSRLSGSPAVPGSFGPQAFGDLRVQLLTAQTGADDFAVRAEQQRKRNGLHAERLGERGAADERQEAQR